MSAFSYKISVEAKTTAEAEAKVKAVSILLAELSGTELNRLAEVVKNDPKTLAAARVFLKLK